MNEKYEKIITKKNIISEKSINIWQIRASVYMILYMLVSGIFFAFLPLTAIILSILGISVYLFIIIYYFPRLCKSSLYLCRSDEIIIKKGIIIRKNIRVAFSQIQYVVLSEGIIERIFSLCSIRVFMAGGAEVLWEISKKDAYAFKELTENYSIRKERMENE